MAVVAVAVAVAVVVVVAAAVRGVVVVGVGVRVAVAVVVFTVLHTTFSMPLATNWYSRVIFWRHCALKLPMVPLSYKLAFLR